MRRRPPLPASAPLAALASLALLAVPAAASAQGTVDLPFAPRGQPIPVDGVRPDSMPGALYALRAPIAVHGAPGTSAATLYAVRDAAVAALDALERHYHFPLPAPDGTRGGGPELDVYVRPDGPPVETTVDALEYGAAWDRASAFVTVRGDLQGDALARATAEGVARAVLLGIDAHAPRPWRIALAASLAARVTELGPDPSAIAHFQRDPGAALLANRDDDSARGAALFFDYLAARYDRADLPLLRGLAWMPVAQTPADAPRFEEEPDPFDVLVRLLRDEPGGFEGVLEGFTLARALVGTAGDAAPALLGYDDDPALAPDSTASLDYRALPAWVTPARPLDETGAAYVTIDTSRAPADGAVRLWFHGAPWRRWAVDAVSLDAEGRVAGRVPGGPVTRGEWSAQLESLAHVARVLVVITDLGDGDYDPDDAPERNGFFALNVATGPSVAVASPR